MKKLKAFLDGLDEQKLYGILWKAYLVQAAVFLGLAEGMALMAEEKKTEKPDGKKGGAQ